MIGREQLARLWSNLLALGARRLAALAVIGIGVFAAVGFGSYYLSRPDYETLYVGLNAQDVSRIGAALKEAGIAFDVGSDGTKVLVRHGQTAQARMLLAEKGLPSSANSGYELFDKLGPMGLTSFMQEVTRVRALEGEIARTIQAMKGVKAARVHIVLPDSGSFRRTPQPPSASVVIRTEWAGDASSAQAIRHLVAAAVPGMNVDQVTVLNTDGTVMAAAGDPEGAAPGRMAALEKSVGKELQHNVRKTLAPYLGLDNFEVSVAARINTDKRQINETEYNPETKVERSVRVVKETGSSQNVNSRAAASVEQNLPADQPSTRSGDQSSRQNERREELTNYEMNTKTISTLSDGYKIENLTIAVVINRKRLLASLGKDAGQEAIDRQLKELETLVGSAAGVDAKRGDRVTIAAVDFFRNEQPMEPVPSPGILELLLGQLGSLLNAGAIVIATIILIWFGLRPTVRAILEQSPPKPIAGGGLAVEKSGTAQSIPGPRPLGESEPNLIADLTSRLGRTPQKRLEQMVDLDEDQAAAILKQWVRGAGRA